MFKLTQIINNVVRDFKLHKEVILYRTETSSTLLKLQEDEVIKFGDSILRSLSIGHELRVIDEDGNLFQNNIDNKINSNYQFSEFLPNNLAFLRGHHGVFMRGVFDLVNSKLILNCEEFNPRVKNILFEFGNNKITIVSDREGDNYTINKLFIFEIFNNNKCTKPKYSFNFDFPNHASHGTIAREKTYIKKNIGIINNKLYLSFTDNSLMIIDIDKGEVLQHLGFSDGGKIKRDPINHLVTADFLGGGFVDANIGYLFNLYNSVLYYFDANTEEIEQVDLSQELEGKNLDGAIIKYYDDDIFAILDLLSGGVGIIDRHTHKLVWHQTMYFEGKKVRPLELKISGNYMCITDSAEQLHIFERTIALKEENTTS